MHAESLDLPERRLHGARLGWILLLGQVGIAGQIVPLITRRRIDQLDEATMSVHQVMDEP